MVSFWQMSPSGGFYNPWVLLYVMLVVAPIINNGKYTEGKRYYYMELSITITTSLLTPLSTNFQIH